MLQDTCEHLNAVLQSAVKHRCIQWSEAKGGGQCSSVKGYEPNSLLTWYEDLSTSQDASQKPPGPSRRERRGRGGIMDGHLDVALYVCNKPVHYKSFFFLVCVYRLTKCHQWASCWSQRLKGWSIVVEGSSPPPCTLRTLADIRKTHVLLFMLFVLLLLFSSKKKQKSRKYGLLRKSQPQYFSHAFSLLFL